MGQFAYPVCVRIEDVKKEFGNKNNKLFEDITKQDPGVVNELKDIIFSYVPENERTPSKSKFLGLVKAKDGSGLYRDWYKYFYALHALTRHVGKDLFDEGDIFKYGSDWWSTIDSALTKTDSKFRLERMAEYKKIFDTPFEENEGCTNIYSRNEIPAFYDDFLKVESIIDKSDEELMSFYADFKSALKYCKENNLDLVTFLI